MRYAEEAFIDCAIIRSVLMPSMSPDLPITAVRIAANTIWAVEAAVAILLMRARRMSAAEPTRNVARWITPPRRSSSPRFTACLGDHSWKFD